MYVGGSHTAQVLERVDLPDKCKACGAERTAGVRAGGMGSASSPYVIGSQRAGGRGAGEAASDAFHLAEQALSVAPCPACGKKNVEETGFNPAAMLASIFAGGAAGFVFTTGDVAATIGGAVFGGVMGALLARARTTRAAT